MTAVLLPPCHNKTSWVPQCKAWHVTEAGLAPASKPSLTCTCTSEPHVAAAGWVFDGVLADGDNKALGIRGQDWECPILAQLPCVSRDAAIAAIAVSTAAVPAAIAAEAKLRGHLDQAATSSSSSSKSDRTSQAGPGTPLLKGWARLKAISASLPSISGFGGSCLSLGAAAEAAAADDATSSSSSSSGGPAPCPGIVSGSDDTELSAATAVASAIAAAGSASAAAAATGVGASTLVLPLTEPALAAATSAAEAAPISHDDAILSHPAVNVDTWVEEQTQQQVGSAGDAVAVIRDDDAASDSAAKQLKVVPASGFSSSSSSGGGKRWWLCMSPDACNNPITWWLGDYDGRRFDIAAADGPHRLDLGTTLYAATLWEDPQVRLTGRGCGFCLLSVYLCPCTLCDSSSLSALAQAAVCS
jgi:sucrose-6-phosphate hydrolase SacC (GH32 family)